MKLAKRFLVFNDETRSCPISLDILKDHYQQSFGVENPMVDSGNIPATDDSTNVGDDWEMSLEDVEWAISRLNADSAPGPDGVIVRAIKIKCVSEILLKIFNRMASLGVVVKCLKKARTILIDKGGPVQEIKNWRPITILPIIRRIFEKVLERELRNVAIINTNQRGFMSMPGCAINITIVENALDLARSEKNDLFCVFVDVNQAYNNIGHNQIKKCIGKMNVHDKIKHLVTECQLGNESSIEVGTDKSSCFTFKKGLLQGAPLSPLLYNIATNHIIDELTEEGLINNYGVKITPSIRMTALAFADDICLLSNSINSAGILFEIVNRRLSNLGMSLNVAKTQAIVIKKGVCCSDGFTLNGCSIVPVSEEKCVRYLGANFREQVMLDKEATIKNLGEKIDKVAKSPYLKADQKLKILNNYVWPVLTYKLQTTPLDRWSIPFVDDLDKMIRSAVKQILEIPKDVPDALIYTSRNVRGLQMFRFSWEILIQRMNLFLSLKKQQDPVITSLKNLDSEIKTCLNKLDVSVPVEEAKPRIVRDKLREKEFRKWEEMKLKGAGVSLFKEVPSHNKYLTTKEGLTNGEVTEVIKMCSNTVAVRAIPGRSQDGVQCRRCPTGIENKPTETLSHVLGNCQFGQLLRINRHNTVRSIIAKEFRKMEKFEVYEEVGCVADDGSSRRIDIIVIDRKTKKGLIIDPTIRFEINSHQALEVDEEKKNIYVPTVSYFKKKYGLIDIEVIGVLIGARGTITSFFKDLCKKFNIREDTIKTIVQSVIRSSITIIRNHIYGPR